KLEITDAMKSYAKEKLERLSKYVKDSDVNANLLFKINGIKQKLEVTIPLKNFTLRVEEVGDDFYAVVDTAVDKLERQIRKNKTRLENKQVKSKVDFDFMSFDEKDEENANKIVRRKQVELKPMDEEEAILQMELINHDFFGFKNVEEDCVSIVYKRKDGHYGIINLK
ncbi:MAG: ribosomal subunit interface protein, partial [Mycoplasma sp. CAG:611_25_7]